MNQAVDVIIRTTGQRERRASLQRAIQSVLQQQGVVARPIVVLIGNLPGLAAELGNQHGVMVHHVDQPVRPGRAARIGRTLIDAEFYTFLDDDDELLPHALGTGLDIMRGEPAVDLVVTTGYWFSGDHREIHIPDITRHQDNSIAGLIERCWLSSCGGLYRASAISQKYFDGLPDHCEWTCLAFRLALDRRNIRFVGVPTYNAHDTPGSQSKGSEFLEAMVGVLAELRSHPLAPAVRKQLERKYRAALHDAAEHFRQTNQLRKAWWFHLKSMKPPHTLLYSAYTRKLLWTGRAAVH